MKIIDLFVPTKRNGYRAYLLKKSGLTLLVLIALVFNIYSSLFPVSQTAAKVDANSLLYFHNKERAKYNLGPLTFHSKLLQSSKYKADVLLEHDCWDHYCPIPPGVSPWEAFVDAGYEYEAAGENLGQGFIDNATLLKAWMQSPTHRENILKDVFIDVGIGFAYGKFQNIRNNTIVAVHFGKPLHKYQTINEEEASSASSDEDRLYDINILEPQDNFYTIDFEPEIQGVVNGKIKEVILFNNGDKIGSTYVQNDSFLFRAKDFSELDEGKNELQVKGFDESSKSYKGSNKVIVNVDSIPPIIDPESYRIEEVRLIDEKIKVKISFAMNNDVYEGLLKSTTCNKKGYFESSRLFFDMCYEDISLQNEVTLEVVDKAGNKIDYELDIAKILVEVDQMEIVEDERNIIGEVLSHFKETIPIDFSYIGIRTYINLGIVLFLIILIIIDYIIIKKYYHFVDLQRNGNHHIKIAMLIGIAILILISAGYGTVLTGITI